MSIDAQILYAIVLHMSASTILSVRISPAERAILSAAAEQAHATLSEFVRRKAIESAEMEVLNHAVVAIPAKDWEAFESWLARPPEPIPALVELAREA